jgi:biopolymer transport protein ExbB
MDINELIAKGGIIVKILIFFNILGFSAIIIFLINYFKFDKNQTFISSTNIEYQIKKIEFGLPTIKIIAIISPLLGLLGTVYGILTSFEQISLNGLDNPTIFSNGISVALITTIAGLIVAIPHYVAYNLFIAMLDKLELKLKANLHK